MNIKEELEKFVPPSEILKRRGGGGEYSYVDRFYVITTLNRIYGHDGWTTRLDVNLCGDRYVATCQLVVGGVTRSETGECLLDSYGKPNENAATEAATQAFKRAASQLGNVFGLHLYREGKPPTPMAQPTSPPAQVAQVAQVVATPQVVAGTLTKPDYQGAIQDAMANAEASAPPPVQQQPQQQPDYSRLEAARNIGLAFGFGKNPRYEKGTPICELDDGALGWYSEAIEKSTHDTEKLRWKDQNMELLNNIRLVLNNTHVQIPQEHAQPEQPGESWGPQGPASANSTERKFVRDQIADDDIPF